MSNGAAASLSETVSSVERRDESRWPLPFRVKSWFEVDAFSWGFLLLSLPPLPFASVRRSLRRRVAAGGMPLPCQVLV